MHDDGVTQKSVQPCKIGPHLYPSPCSVAFGGREVSHHGRYDLLHKSLSPITEKREWALICVRYQVFDPAMMEWVPTSHGAYRAP